VNLVVNAASGGTGAGITITGANDSSTINLGSGTDSVTLGSANETVNGGGGADTIHATAARAGALLTGGAGNMTLALSGGGAAAMNAADTGVTVTLAAASSAYTFTANNEPTLAISGTSGLADIIDLGAGADTVTLSTSKQTVNGGAGTDTYIVTAATIGATINGGAGSGTLSVRGGGTVTMGSNITNIQTVMLGRGTVFTANGLNLSILGSGFADTIQAGSGSDVITGDGGADTLIGGSGATTFKDVAQHLTTATLENFTASDTIDITNLKFSTSKPTTAIWAGNVLTVTQGATVDKIKLVGSYTGTFSTKTDGANGVDITYIPPGGGSVPAFAQAMASLGDTTAASAFVAASATTATPTLLANVH